MQKILFLTHNKSMLAELTQLTSLQFDFQVFNFGVAVVPLIQSWRPHIVVCHFEKVDLNMLLLIRRHFSSSHLGLIVVAKEYNLKDEILAYKYGIDHYFLLASPAQLITARVANLAIKIQDNRRLIDEAAILQLPQKFQQKANLEVTLFPEQNVIQFQNNRVKLPPVQMRIASAFLSHEGELLTRTWLKNNLFINSNISFRSIDAHIAKLKKSFPYFSDKIESIYREGYIFRRSQQIAS